MDKVPAIVVEALDLVRHGLRQALDPTRYRVISCSATLDDILALSGAEEDYPSIAILGAELPEVPAMYNAITKKFPGCRVALLVDSLSHADLDAMLHSGVDGCLLKSVTCEGLVKALDLILEGVFVLPLRPEIGYAVLPIGSEAAHASGGLPGSAPPPSSITANLSERELRVLQGLAMGASNKMIARSLGITDSTVKVHVKSIFRKTKVGNRIQLALLAAGAGEHLSAVQRRPGNGEALAGAMQSTLLPEQGGRIAFP